MRISPQLSLERCNLVLLSHDVLCALEPRVCAVRGACTVFFRLCDGGGTLLCLPLTLLPTLPTLPPYADVPWAPVRERDVRDVSRVFRVFLCADSIYIPKLLNTHSLCVGRVPRIILHAILLQDVASPAGSKPKPNMDSFHVQAALAIACVAEDVRPSVILNVITPTYLSGLGLMQTQLFCLAPQLSRRKQIFSFHLKFCPMSFFFP